MAVLSRPAYHSQVFTMCMLWRSPLIARNLPVTLSLEDSGNQRRENGKKNHQRTTTLSSNERSLAYSYQHFQQRLELLTVFLLVHLCPQNNILILMRTCVFYIFCNRPGFYYDSFFRWCDSCLVVV